MIGNFHDQFLGECGHGDVPALTRLVLYYKRLERGTFAWLDRLELMPGSEILASDFALVLAGINPTEVKRQKRYQRIPSMV